MFLFKAIKPATKFKSSVFRELLRRRAEQMAPKVVADFQKTTRTWNNVHPVFTSRVGVGARANADTIGAFPKGVSGVSLVVSTDDRIYGFLDRGTKVRYATMTRNFIAKTRPGIIGSRAGRGGLLFVSRNRPRPGIKARKFSLTIAKKWQAEFRKQMQQALNEGARASGHGIQR